MATAPFASAGLGMWGKDKEFAEKGMVAKPNGNSLAGLLASLFVKPTNPYALQGAAVPGAAGQGVAPPAVPGGIGMNPARRSGMGLTSSTGLQAPAAPMLGAPANTAGEMPTATDGAGLDINNLIDSFWGAS